MAKIRLLPLLVVGVLTACTGGDDAASTTTSTTTTTLTMEIAPVASRADAYFGALASNAADGAATGSATPGSEAELYAGHQAAARGLLGAASPRTLAVAGQGFEICDDGAPCVAYSAVVTDPATGSVTGFSIDAVPLTGRIVGTGLVADRDGVVARVVSAYRSNGGDVSVLLEVDNTTDVGLELFGFAAVLEPGLSGAGIETTGAWGSGSVEAGATTDLLLLFPSTEIGGRLRLSGLRSDGLDIELEMRVPTP